MAVSTIVGMAECFSQIVEHQPPNGGEQSYIVRIAPVSPQSSLNQLLISIYNEHLKEHPEGITMWDGNPSPLSLKTFYTKHLANENMGELPFDSPMFSGDHRELSLRVKADVGSVIDALESAFASDGRAIPYAAPVVLVELLLPRPLETIK